MLLLLYANALALVRERSCSCTRTLLPLYANALALVRKRRHPGPSTPHHRLCARGPAKLPNLYVAPSPSAGNGHVDNALCRG